MEGDILTDVLRAVHISGAIFFDVHAASPWASEAPHSRKIRPLVMPNAQHLIEYHVMVSGSCWATLVDGIHAPVELLPGSILIFPHGDAHAMSSQPNGRATPDLSTFAPGTPENPRPFYLHPGGDGPKSARIICGFLGCDSGPFNPLLQALPRLLHVADGTSAEGGLLGTLIEATVRESEAQRLGGGGVLSKLAELIFIEAVRRYAETQPDAARNWLVGLSEPLVGRAARQPAPPLDPAGARPRGRRLAHRARREVRRTCRHASDGLPGRLADADRGGAPDHGRADRCAGR